MQIGWMRRPGRDARLHRILWGIDAQIAPEICRIGQWAIPAVTEDSVIRISAGFDQSTITREKVVMQSNVHDELYMTIFKGNVHAFAAVHQNGAAIVLTEKSIRHDWEKPATEIPGRQMSPTGNVSQRVHVATTHDSLQIGQRLTIGRFNLFDGGHKKMMPTIGTKIRTRTEENRVICLKTTLNQLRSIKAGDARFARGWNIREG